MAFYSRIALYYRKYDMRKTVLFENQSKVLLCKVKIIILGMTCMLRIKIPLCLLSHRTLYSTAESIAEFHEIFLRGAFFRVLSKSVGEFS